MFNSTKLPSEKEIIDKNKEILLTSKNKIELIIDGQFNIQRFAILDKNQNPIWFGKEFNNSFDSQWEFELDVAKKAIWVAQKIKELLNLDQLVLVLNTDCQALRYQSKWSQKGFVLTFNATKNNIGLIVKYIQGGNKNPADKYVRTQGFQKFNSSANFSELLDDWNESLLNSFYESNNKCDEKDESDFE